jgi:uncharacterized protein (TIGR03435 family)
MAECDRLKALALALSFTCLATPVAYAQSASAVAPQPAFEVASIKPSAPSEKGDGSWSPPGIGQFWARGLSLKYLIHLAYDIDLNQIAGKQPWLDSAYFDINAKPEEGIALSRAELRPRLQNLLQTRFHLVTHYETRMDPGYALVVANGGPKLMPTKGDKFPGFRINVSPGHVEGINWSMDYLAAMLQQAAGRPVANQTQIAGSYDVKLEFAPDIETESTLPSIFTVLKSTLGLELKPQHIPVQVLAIDSVDRAPTEN